MEGAILAFMGVVIWRHRNWQQQHQQHHLAGVLQDTLKAAVATIRLKRPLPKAWCGSALPSTPW